MATPVLKPFLDLLFSSDAEEFQYMAAWQTVTPLRVRDELAGMASREGALTALWNQARDPEVGRFLAYYYQSQYDAMQVETERLHHALMGMVSGGIASAAAHSGNAHLLAQSLLASLACWAGQPGEVSVFHALLDEAVQRIGAAESAPAAPLAACLGLFEEQQAFLSGLGATRDWLHALLTASSPPSEASEASAALKASLVARLEVPLLAYRQGHPGAVNRLHLELAANGSGHIFPAPLALALTPMTGDFLEAVEIAWEVARQQVPPAAWQTANARWSLEPEAEGEPLSLLEGGSHGAGMCVGLTQLLRRERFFSGVALTATLGRDGSLGAVEGVREKARAAFGLRDRWGRSPIARLVVSPANLEEAQAACLEVPDGMADVVCVTHLSAYLPIASGRSLWQQILAAEETLVCREAETHLERPIADWAALEKFYVPVRLEKEERGERLLPGEEASPADLPEFATTRTLTTWERERAYFRLGIVLGEPGYGKTMLLWQEVGTRCREAQERAESFCALEGAHPPLALFFRAVEWMDALVQTDGETRDVFAALGHLLETRYGRQTNAPLSGPGAVVRLLLTELEAGRCLIAIDALDEVPLAALEALEAALTTLSQECPGLRLLCSARREGFRPGFLPADTVLALLAFEEYQVERAVRAWFHQEPEIGVRLLESLRANENIRHVLRSPLLLRLACSIATRSARNREPLLTWNRRSDLYAAFLETAREQWALRKQVRSREQIGLFLAFAADFALEMMQRETEEARPAAQKTQDTLAAAINTARAGYPALQGRELLEDLCASGILTNASSDLIHTSYTFTHRTLCEYLSACSLSSVANHPAQGWPRIAANVDRWACLPVWQETLIFLAGRMSDPIPLLQLLSDPLRDDLLRHRLALAARCLPEIRLS